MKNVHSTTFVLIHGAWLGGWAWTQVNHLLREQGMTIFAPDLPGHGNNTDLLKPITFYSYLEEVLHTMNTFEGPTILVGHSFAGIIISQIAEYRHQEVAGLVYLSACLLPTSLSFNDAVKGIHGSMALDNLEVHQDGKTITIKEDCLHMALAYDLPPHVFESAKINIIAEPVTPLGVPLTITREKWGSVPRFYIECTEDLTIPLESQQAMHQSLGVQQVFSLNSSHLPMLSCPLELSDHLVTIANAISQSD